MDATFVLESTVIQLCVINKYRYSGGYSLTMVAVFDSQCGWLQMSIIEFNFLLDNLDLKRVNIINIAQKPTKTGLWNLKLNSLLKK